MGGAVNRFARHGWHRGTRGGLAPLLNVVLAVAALGMTGWLVVSTVPQADPAGGAAPKWFGIAATPDGNGYWVVSSAGAVESFGDAVSYGNMASTPLNQSVVGMAPTPDGRGYWLDAADGGIFSFGDAGFFGSTGSLVLNKPVVGMAPTHDGRGYWLVASDGGIFAFGDASFEGSMGGHVLNEPVVGMVPTQDGRGYWLVASDGGIFAFGDASFEGSLGGSPPSSPIAYMAPAPNNQGYWLVGQDGTVYSFGDGHNYGSVQGSSVPATSMAATPSGNGYWVLTADGVVHPFGKAANYGSPATGPVAASSGTTGSSTSGSTSGGTSPSVSITTTPVSSPASSSVSVKALAPSSGTTGGGTTVQISGSGFSGATAVEFGPNASSDFSVTSPTTITAVAPVGAGSVDVSVMTPGGTSSQTDADQFRYVPTAQLPISANGQNLEIGGVPTKFTGYNAYQLATDWGTNAGCGGQATPAQIDAFFASLRPNSIVRFWAFQGSMATNVNTDQLDWQPLDDVFYAAARYHVYLIPVISGQDSSCDGTHWQDPAWYSGGFMDVDNSPSNSDGRGLTPLSYWDYMKDLVSRYADSPALGMWEPMSEAEASTCPAAFEPTNCEGHQTCPDEAVAANTLKYFFTTVGTEIHLLDPSHLVEAGFLGSGQCGTVWHDYENVGASPGIDVLSVHDYYGSAAMGGDQWNGLGERFAQAKALDKPIITGEAGIVAGDGQPGCESMQQRASDMAAKMTAQFGAGDSAFLVWNWLTDPLGPCSYNTGQSDSPLEGLIGSVSLAG